ncbi:selenium-dependent molybdenum hydroxylase system protein, YqeB family [Anaerolinea thermolimosa]|uniref:selenium-dependent molybdenum cofactor biosynthesis protein YqeB n=1 Tax=Anaerolinea thermolimosa TaxID=229919 RepID=UPI00078265E5|nr:selenium-dependent molybdenum cofactor biosynthesis protein YqeB [Anaerolinea thermolimosa]GAP06370.1 selenium-dependent molybdenum hydroxylase system protein, YqeB family [Anaerolinea thermolimosa]
MKRLRIIVRGGGDLASGVALRCFRAGWKVLVTELEKPLAVRRLVSFGQAIYDLVSFVEEVQGVRVESMDEVDRVIASGNLPVVIDPECTMRQFFHPDVIVDARMQKKDPLFPFDEVPLYIGLGPGFVAGKNCHAVIETVRGPFLGRVIWEGAAEADTGLPDPVNGMRETRVLRSPTDGILTPIARIGDLVDQGDPIAEVNGQVVLSPFPGVLRGLVHEGVQVTRGMKIGDVDPRKDPRLCQLVSDKALAVGGGVLEAILMTFNHEEK